MKYKSFKNWCISEGKDIFGFSSDDFDNKGLAKNEKTKPIHRIDAEAVFQILKEMKLGHKVAIPSFPHRIQWGETNGAVRLIISPLGSFKAIVRRLRENAKGEKVWICKTIIPFNDYLDANPQFDESLAHVVFDLVEQADHTNVESPKTDYENLEGLTFDLAHVCKNNQPDIFLYQGIKKVNEDRYIIYFELRGGGIEAPGAERIEQFNIDVNYLKKEGVIKIIGQEISSPAKGHVWIPQPSEFEEYFFPTQPEEEICECIAAALSTY